MKQTERVLDYMRRFGSITTMQAFADLGVARLSARIADLKDEGFDIVSETLSTKNRYGEHVRYAKYRLNE
jgi:hypothetical protein